MPNRTMTRWSPVQLDFVEVDGLPSLFRLQRFEPGPSVNFDDTDRLRQITEAARQLVEADSTLDVQGGKVAKLKTDSDWPPLACTFARHSFDAWANRIVFTCEEVDLLLAATMQTLAKAGDLSLVLADTIGVFDEQTTQTVPELWQQKMKVKVLATPKEALTLLKKSHKEQRGGRSATARKRFGDRHFDVPGLWPQRACAHFIEVAESENPRDLFEAIDAFETNWRKANPDADHGTLSSTSWTLTLPAGDRFGAVTWAGKAALEMLTDFAQQHDKRQGYVSNFSTLVLGDGSSYEVAKCHLSETNG